MTRTLSPSPPRSTSAMLESFNLGNTSLLAEVESDITHICLHLLKYKLDAVVALVLDSGVRRELDKVVGFQCNDSQEKIAALKG